MVQKIHVDKSMKELLQMYLILRKKNIGEDIYIYGLIMLYMKNVYVIILK